MRTPRDILLERHQAAVPKLDALRREIVAGLNHKDTKARSWAAKFESLCLGGSKQLWLELVWPSRRIWSGLAAIWILLFIANLSIRDHTELTAAKSPPSPEMISSFRQQEKLLAELMGPKEPPAAEPPKTFSPRPSSERPFEILTA